MLRGHAGEPTHVVVLATEHPPARGGRGRRRRRPRPIGSHPAPATVSTTRATLIAARAFVDEHEAVHWLERVDAEAEVATAIAALNDLLHLHRTATADATVREVGRRQALVARVGVGEGEQVAEGRFARAVELPPPAEPRRRGAALRPDERLAALLSGRDAALACEELTLRARADLTADRRREAALQLRVALAAALRELTPWALRGDMERRIAELEGLRPAVEAAAAAALEGGVDDERTAEVGHALDRLEAALRARSAVGLD